LLVWRAPCNVDRAMKKQRRKLELKSSTIRILQSVSVVSGWTGSEPSKQPDLCSRSCNICPTNWSYCCPSYDTDSTCY
jgi:hypothetical protein